jgi:hypothetical protein
LAFEATGVPSGAYFVPLGDVTLDGTLTKDTPDSDEEVLRAHLAGSTQLRSEQLGVADVDENGRIEGVDVDLIDQLVAGAQPPLNKYRLVWHPTASQVGNHTVTVTVTEPSSGATDSETFTITVESPNHAPSANAGADQVVVSGKVVYLNGSGSSDPDGDPLTYQWTQTGGPAVTLSDPAALQPTFTAPTVSIATDLTFTLTVSDGRLTSTDAVKITITVQPTPPDLIPTDLVYNQADLVDGKTVVFDSGILNAGGTVPILETCRARIPGATST